MKKLFGTGLTYLASHLMNRFIEFGTGKRLSFPVPFYVPTDKELENQRLFYPYTPRKTDPMFVDGLENQVAINFPSLAFCHLPNCGFSMRDIEKFSRAESEAVRRAYSEVLKKKGFPVIENASIEFLGSLLSEEDYETLHNSGFRKTCHAVIARMPHFIMGTNPETNTTEIWLYKGKKKEFRLLSSFAPKLDRENIVFPCIRACNPLCLVPKKLPIDETLNNFLDCSLRAIKKMLDDSGIYWVRAYPFRRMEGELSLALAIPTRFMGKLPFLDEEQRIFSRCYNTVSGAMIACSYDYRGGDRLAPELVALLDEIGSKNLSPSDVVALLIHHRAREASLLLKMLYDMKFAEFDVVHSVFFLGIRGRKTEDGFLEAEIGAYPVFPIRDNSKFSPVLLPKTEYPWKERSGFLQFRKSLRIRENDDIEERAATLAGEFMRQEPDATTGGIMPGLGQTALFPAVPPFPGEYRR